jgi:hypothetical protein
VSDEGCGVGTEEEHSGQVRRHEHCSDRRWVGSVAVSCGDMRFLWKTQCRLPNEYLKKLELWVYLFTYLFAYSSRTNIPIWTKLGMLIPWDQEENIAGLKLRKSFPEFDPIARKLSTIEERCQDHSWLASWSGRFTPKQ